jgi:hypothetical protein
MGSRGSKTLIEQAADAVEAAVESAVEKAGPVVADARDKAAPVLAEAKEKAAPVIADAKEKALPILAQGAAVAAERAASAADYAASAAADARDAANAKAAELQPESKKKHRLRKFLIFAGIAAALGFVVKKLTSRSGTDDWQSSYAPPTDTAATAGTPFSAPATSADEGADEGGASPDEAIADATAEGHAVTTPENPADVVAVESEAAEKSGRKA